MNFVGKVALQEYNGNFVLRLGGARHKFWFGSRCFSGVAQGPEQCRPNPKLAHRLDFNNHPQLSIWIRKR